MKERGNDPPPNTAQDPHKYMFGTLLASKPPREGGAAAAAGTASLIFHGAIIAAAIAATLAVGEEVAKEEVQEDVTFVKIEEVPPPPPPPPVETPPPPPEVTKPKGFQTLTAPEVVPVEIPPPDTVATNEADFSGEGAEGGIAEGEAAPFDTSQTFLTAQVSVVPKMTKVVKPNYPEFLKKMEIEGTVVLQAVIKTDGNVDGASVRVIKKLHPQLDEEARKALVASEFSPALYGDRPVRVIMQIPYTFKFR